MLREALSNVALHAGATEAGIRVAAVDGALAIVVTDNGKGPGAEPRGGGIASMRSRARRHGGGVTVVKGDHGGTVVEWRVPPAHDDRLGRPVPVPRS